MQLWQGWPAADTVPLGQSSHLFLVLFSCAPAGQSSQYVEPLGDVPVVHVKQAVIPDEFVNKPALHSSHRGLRGCASFAANPCLEENAVVSTNMEPPTHGYRNLQ